MLIKHTKGDKFGRSRINLIANIDIVHCRQGQLRVTDKVESKVKVIESVWSYFAEIRPIQGFAIRKPNQALLVDIVRDIGKRKWRHVRTIHIYDVAIVEHALEALIKYFHTAAHIDFEPADRYCKANITHAKLVVSV